MSSELSIHKNQKTMATKKSDSIKRTTVGMDISWQTEDSTANSKSGESLQEAFKKFRNHRQRAIRLSKEIDENVLKSRADPVLMERLRMKFLERCKHYFGVPYAKKYQDPDSLEFNSPIFLDCCGLIRRVLRDLKEDFGFEIGPWNQAYMFDTLPKDIEGTEKVKPGDLVFVSGIYYNKKSKRQRHNMVHVEVWAGDGEKTIGARWQKGKVQYHDSYKFTAKSYHSMQYHFKSIDTWLMGICKSHCKEHAWKRSTYKPGKKSIFSVDQTDELEDEEANSGEESDSQTHNNSDKKDSKNSALEATNSDSKHYLRRKHQNLTNKTDLRLVKNFMIEKNQLPRATNQTVLRESNSATISNSGLRISNLNHQSSELTTFYDLEDCVQWLIFHVTTEAESELTVMGDNFVELNHWDSRIMSTDSVSMDSGEGRITVDGLVKTSVSSCTELKRIQNCCCPQCFHVEMHCVHEKTSNSKNMDKRESEYESLEENRELSTSLECFDFVFDCGNQYEQISSDCIIQCPNHSNTNGSRRSTRSVSPSKATRNGKGGGSSGDRGGDNEKNNKKDTPFKNTRDGAKSVNRLSMKQPSFFIGGGNGNWMIEATLVSLGWRKIEDKRDESFKLKWVECKSQINYESFREGEQIANHISNISLLTTKLGLLCSLQEYERVTEKVGRAVASKMRIPLSEFVPETHRLMGTSEKLKFVNEVYKDGETWICKPTGMNQGKGIYLVSSREQLVEKMNLDGTDDGDVRRSRVRPPQGRIIQRYVMNPLLLNGYKFDIRAYMLIASTTPYIVLYHPGYVRLSCVPYTPYTQDDGGLHAHLTNQFVQKKHPMYSSMKEDTVWSFDRLQSYIDQKYAKDKELPENWVFTTFTKRMHQIMCTCFQSVRQKLHRRTGTFDLLGFDFLIDDDFKVWLLEVNINPALHTNCQVLMDLLPGVVDETLKLVIEICDKTKKKRSILPLENLKGFQVLYCEGGK